MPYASSDHMVRMDEHKKAVAKQKKVTGKNRHCLLFFFSFFLFCMRKNRNIWVFLQSLVDVVWPSFFRVAWVTWTEGNIFECNGNHWVFEVSTIKSRSTMAEYNIILFFSPDNLFAQFCPSIFLYGMDNCFKLDISCDFFFSSSGILFFYF